MSNPNTQKAEKLERETRGALYDAVAERDDFIRHAARLVRVCMWMCVSCRLGSIVDPFF